MSDEERGDAVPGDPASGPDTRSFTERLREYDLSVGLPPHREIKDPKAVRALAHPTRLALLELFSARGGEPLTATQASELIDESPTNCAFHLRTLAKYGYVEQAEGGKGRERPWRLAHLGFSYSPEDAVGRQANAEFSGFFYDRLVARYRRFAVEGAAHPQEIREMAGAWDTAWFVTPEEYAELREQIRQLVLNYRDRFDPKRRPAGAVPVQALFVTVPVTDIDLKGE
jgi:DNA-binding transcriptional ArsR family regulator